MVATFRHDTSRNLDPQLHTHAVLANMVQGEDGKWRTMANEGLYECQKLIGAIYRNELAAGLGRLGYDIEKTHADGRFEIAGVSREAIRAFSTRRAEIEAAMAERGLGDTADNPRHAERAALMTRATKRDVDREELRRVWHRQAIDLDLHLGTLGVGSRDHPLEPEPHGEGRAPTPGAGAGLAPGTAQPELPASPAVGAPEATEGPRQEAVDKSVPHELPAGSEDPLPGPQRRNPGRGMGARAPLRARGRVCAVGPARGGPVLRAGHVQHRGRRARGGGAGEGRHAARRELAGSTGLARDRPHGGRGARDHRPDARRRGPRAGHDAPLAGPGAPPHGSAHRGPEGRRGADPVGEGPGGGGPGLCRHGQDEHAAPRAHPGGEEGLAPAGLGAVGLRGEDARRGGGDRVADAAGIPRPQCRRGRGAPHEAGCPRDAGAFAKTILVVDEGSLASTVQARDLLRIAAELRIPRVVLVGDAKQLDAVDAGKPFAQLQAAGMKTAVMDEIMRQRDPALREAVEASLKGDIGRAFGKLGNHVAEAEGRDIGGAVAARWLALAPKAREATGVMAPSHDLRLRINGHIRDALAREGRLHGPAVQAERLVSKGYTQAEKALAGNYAKGDVVAFYRAYKRIGVDKGDERRVVGLDDRRRAVLLDDGKGGTVAWKPSQIGGRSGGTEVYRAEGIELRSGDRIRWTRNDAGLGLVNSRTAEVLRVGNGRVAFRLEDGRRLDLRPGDPQLRHLDHAWASTVHAFQGRTVDNVIAAIEARHPHLTTQKSFYVEISRARERAELVTDDAAELRAQLQAVTGERIAALEGIGEMPREAPARATEAGRTHGKADGMDSEKGAGRGSVGADTRAAERETAGRDRGLDLER